MFATRFKKQKTLLIKVDADILKNQEIEYTNGTDCYIARAILRQFTNVKDVDVCPTTVYIEETRYNILGRMGQPRFLEHFGSTNIGHYWENEGGFIVIPLVRG
jgi:hypothetical protein